nr:hypothetical protein [Tanacetum cinerariifolium]
MVSGGSLVLGRNVFEDVGSDVESKKVFGALREVMVKLGWSSYMNACQGGWIKLFKDSGSEIEHEAFIALWVTIFVFPSSSNMVVKSLCKVAVYLARGVRLAIAPAVLANVYKDFSFLKDRIGLDDETPVIFRLPCSLFKFGYRKDDVGSFVDRCAFEDFIWQPYVKDSNENSGFSMVYQELRRWVIVGDCLDEELESWVGFVRMSQLVRIYGGCIQQYLPRRVVMQLGMNQDVPADIPRKKGIQEIALWFYTRSIKDVRLYVPPSHSRWKELSNEMSSKILPCGDGSCRNTFKPIASLIA